MSTRSCIIVKVRKEDIGKKLSYGSRNGKCETTITKPYIMVYCHWNGHPCDNGRVLLDGYNSYEKALDIMKGGSLSHIEVNECDYYMDWDRKEEWVYNRPIQTDTLEPYSSWCVWAYIFDEDKWNVGHVIDKNGNCEIKNVIELTEGIVENGYPEELY
jgi:hypothetical protein